MADCTKTHFTPVVATCRPWGEIFQYRFLSNLITGVYAAGVCANNNCCKE